MCVCVCVVFFSLNYCSPLEKYDNGTMTQTYWAHLSAQSMTVLRRPSTPALDWDNVVICSETVDYLQATGQPGAMVF